MEEKTISETKGGGERLAVYLLGALALLMGLAVLGTYLWKVVQVRGLEERVVSQRAELEASRTAALGVQAHEMLRLAALPLGWAVRAELLKDDLEGIDDYFRRFVKEPGVNRLLLVSADGMVSVASDRKLEGQPAGDLVGPALLQAQEASLEQRGPELRLAIPVMDFDRRLGLLVVDYAPEHARTAAEASPGPVAGAEPSPR